MRRILVIISCIFLVSCVSGKIQTINPAWTDTQKITFIDAQGKVVYTKITSVPVTPKDSFWHWLFDTAVDVTKKQAGL